MLSALTWPVPALDSDKLSHYQEVVDNKTKPPGSLGKLETLAIQMAQIQLGLFEQSQLTVAKPVVLVFAGDHGIASHGVSIAPAAVTQQMVSNFLAGGAAINCFCRTNDVALGVIDTGMLAPLDQPHSNYIVRRLGAGTNDISVTAAMSEDTLEEGLLSGQHIAEQYLKQGSNVIGFGEMGIGNTTMAAALFAAFCNKQADEVAGRGTGISDEQLALKTALICRALKRSARENDGQLPKPYYLLASLGGFEIVQMVGAMLAAAENGALIVVDGFIVSVAALVACDIAPNARQFMVFAHTSEERAHQMVLDELRADPLLNMGFRLGEGTGAALAIPLLRTAAAVYNDMATFESASVHV
ncbi:nicotinate-nucleotide--dimethylbenzimidazole phosphoribosyltransferase [Aestuariibacter sp. A3R04]|uniref:nicotinate-nucleotide--dimethylbenzimidazole phosphoribosyltransferase n=1 Tax=Aestuariibacter sp. A3R04 TaxID=2841571 RepID=UPI001C07EFD8|nr:nicotinate-nucleotide--dimethylbenzimidazole phosphoribosyltransferase [Aestuariibacter sp. A3R04]MBU3021226.1 nicotinate-nucleotide--dimethylbenzimidazole phosphoribosyltransferase [Aestuariibacter sp. A3R04]